VVRTTGWVFNNERGSSLTLAEFVATGDAEVVAHLEGFGLLGPQTGQQTLVEIGSGIGRQTAGFTRTFGKVFACDLDAAFLERCRETVAQHGDPARLQTCQVVDGRRLPLPDLVSDVTYSYITLQHCERDAALALIAEATRVTKVDGHVALNMRTWTTSDVALWPLGATTRTLWRTPGVGPWLARRRTATRLGWQANRLSPQDVVDHVRAVRLPLTDLVVYQSDRRSPLRVGGAAVRTLPGAHPSHWWLVARRTPA
jgi:ubiquinone/menaquinone biosynthesis C-methylase UbiE